MTLSIISWISKVQFLGWVEVLFLRFSYHLSGKLKTLDVFWGLQKGCLFGWLWCWIWLERSIKRNLFFTSQKWSDIFRNIILYGLRVIPYKNVTIFYVFNLCFGPFKVFFKKLIKAWGKLSWSWTPAPSSVLTFFQVSSFFFI